MIFGGRQINDDADLAIGKNCFEVRISSDLVIIGKLFQAYRVAVVNTAEHQLRVVGERRHVVIGNEAGTDYCDFHDDVLS
jgi:hypothetical protein